MRASTFKIFGMSAEVRGLHFRYIRAETDVRSQRSVTRGGLGESALVAGSTHGFHLSAQHNHSLGNAFVPLRDSYDRPFDRALVNKALKLFISTQAQQLLAATGCVSLPQIEQDNFE
jgi:hypothetical protein